MVEKYTYLHVYSELNPWIDFVITLSQSEDGDRAKQIAEQAYENWFKTTKEVEAGDTTIFGYIKGKLEEENIKCGIFYNDEVKDQFE